VGKALERIGVKLKPRLAGVAAATVLAAVLSTTPSLAQQNEDEPMIGELVKKLEDRERELERRDAIIDDLLRRVGALEQRLAGAPEGGSEAAVPSEVGERAKSGREPAHRAEALGEAPPVRDTDRVSPADARTASAADTPPSAQVGRPEPTAADTAQGSSAAGETFSASEEAAERALERTLVEEGALLLPYGKIDVSPSFSYVHEDEEIQLFNELGNSGLTAVVGSRDVRRDSFGPALDVRLGLPWDSQFEIGIGYQFEHIENSNDFFSRGGPFTQTVDQTKADGFTDFTVGLAKTLVRERAWRPDILARVTWDTNTGATEDFIPLGSGFNELRASLTALKRQDPLAFFASFAYETTFEEDGYDPGDAFNLALGASLGLSPETSMSIGLQQEFSKKDRVNGTQVDGSSEVSSALTFGFSSILSQQAFISVNVGVGLTNDTPDYFVTVAVPIRFSIPTP
jgi:Putative MetA-pathway of phenol degradation